MNGTRLTFIALLALLALAGLWQAWGGPLDETRYCGTPKRDASGQIVRRADVLRAFRDLYPCPATGQSRGACSGFAIDHVIPLASGGCDAVSNLQWLPDAIKRCSGSLCKDRWERRVYPRRLGANSNPQT